MAKLKLLLKEFSKQHHFDEPLADDQGIYLLIIDGMEVKCFEKFGKGYFCSKLATLPEQTSSPLPVVLKNLMNHALARIKSQRCGLGLEKNGDLVLFERFDIDSINLRDFCELLEKYSNALEEYRRFVGAENTKEHLPAAMIISP